jgi:mannose-6-phosphate isomerase
MTQMALISAAICAVASPAAMSDHRYMHELYPLRFAPVYKSYVWGGDKIIRHFRRPAPPGRYAESWEISDRPEGMSVVMNGPLAGRTLHDLVEQHGADLLGAGVAPDRFPLLVKLIDARETLSVQVHPDDASAARVGGEAKSEMWYVLQADPGAAVYRGFHRSVAPADFLSAVREKRLEPLLRRIPVAPGDTVYVPGGCIHAIGAGCLLLEVQQCSNTTHRIYDWDRRGADGKPRELHLDQAMQVLRWSSGPDVRAETWPYFRFGTMAVRGAGRIEGDGASFECLFVESGEVRVNGERCAAGSSLLIPAACRGADIEGDARLCRASLR